MTNSSTPEPALNKTASHRINSLDQFRGYTVVGMLLVNFLSGMNRISDIPRIFLHSHDYCSYADTIMPQFLFAVGFALRLTIGRRLEAGQVAISNKRMVRRVLGLVLISILIYTRPASAWESIQKEGVWVTLYGLFKGRWFQTLLHIAVTSLWILPVIRKSTLVRVSWMLISALLHVGLSYWFNFEWVNASPNGVDGGPLGFLTWTIPALTGSLTCDFIANSEGFPQLKKLVIWSVLIMGFAWILSCGTRMYDVPEAQVEPLKEERLAIDPVFPTSETWQDHLQKPWPDWLAEPPFIPPPDQDHRKWNYWMMSQRGGTLSYPLFCTGVSLLVYVLFYLACDVGSFRSRFFQAFGVNALAAYVLHTFVGAGMYFGFIGLGKLIDIPEKLGTPGVLLCVFIFFTLNYLIVWFMQKKEIYWRV